jgi:hypothetical protein
MAHRLVVLLGLTALSAALSACGGPPTTPTRTAGPALEALPSGGCYDGPLTVDVNGALHDLTRTGARSFVVSGPIFSALEIDLSTDGESVFIQSQRGPRRLNGDPDSCRLSGDGALRAPTRNMPLSIAIAPAA